MKVEKVPYSFESHLKKFAKGQSESQNQNGSFPFQQKKQSENGDSSENMTKEHLEQVENVKEHLETLMNTKLIFMCVFLKERQTYQVQFLDADTMEILLKMTIPDFSKMVDNFIMNKEEGQKMSSKGNFLSIRV